MTSPSGASLPFPGSRALAGWWRQLSPDGEGSRVPEGLWVGHFLLHQIEAPVRLSVHRRLDPFALAVLRAAALDGSATDAALAATLHLGSAVLLRLLRELKAEGLLTDAAAGWTPTNLGREAAERGEVVHAGQGRRTFDFIEPWRPAGPRSDRGPQFLALDHPAGMTPSAGPLDGWEFDPALLADAVRRPADWKERHDFPSDVEGLVTPEGAATWERVILDRREHFVAVFALVPAAEGGERRLLGFSVRQDGWALDAGRPVFALRAGWEELFPELTQEPSPEAWLQAWRVWCQPRSLPPRDVDACRVERDRHLLRVHAPRSLVGRLRAERSDAVKGEAWLLAGTGSVRTAALVELREF